MSIFLFYDFAFPYTIYIFKFGYLDVKTIKGLGKALREIEIHPFRLKDSSESFISSATLPQNFEWFSLDHSKQLIVMLITQE